MLLRSLAGMIACALICLPATAQSADSVSDRRVSGMTVRISSFSGKPVPRFESLKYAAVHGRTGPSLEYPIAWRYERQGLPVMIVKESRDWRKVRDPSGDEVWMHSRTLGGQPSVMVHGLGPVALTSQPRPDARVIANMEQGAIGTLIGCEAEYCQLYVAHRKGWAPKANLWGAPGTTAIEVPTTTAQLASGEVEQQ